MSKKTTQIIKGVTICMMVMHYFCATSVFPELADGLIKLGSVFKICVAVYAVLTGYGYFYAKYKSIRFGLQKILY